MEELTPFGFEIRKDSKGRLCLTDLWIASGSDKSKKPAKWQETVDAKAFIKATCKILNILETDIIDTKRGKSGGSYGHKQILLEYAQYLSPELGVVVNEVYFQRMEEEKNPQLAIDRAVKTWEKKGKTPEWISTRLNGKAARLVFTHTLSSHGVKGIGFKDCTNAIYKPLWGGTAALVRVKKNLPEKSNTRENMTTTELLAVSLAESLASDNINKHEIFGNVGCRNECFRTGSIIAEAVKISLGTR